MNTNSEFDTNNLISTTLLSSLQKMQWWKSVQPEVKEQLRNIVSNIAQLGVKFASTYFALFQWQSLQRKIQGKEYNRHSSINIATMNSMAISEEMFQCGKLPTRVLLDLNDFILPNEADVTACVYLCNKIDFLNQTGLLNSRTNSDNTALKPVLSEEEILYWIFEN